MTPQFVLQWGVVIVSALLSGIWGAVQMRDSVLTEMRAAVAQLRTESTEQMRRDLQHYVTQVQFSDWRRESDRQYYQVLSAIQRVEERLKR